MKRGSSRAVAAMAEGLEGRQLMSTVVAVTGRDTLFFFDSAAPAVTLGKVRVRGLARRESLVGIDYRPATQQLYGLGDSGRLYVIDATTGTATAADATGGVLDPALTGAEFGFDFNPAVDRARVVSDVDTNFRIDPTTGLVVDADTVTPGTQGDLALNYAAGDAAAGLNPNVSAVAYTNNVAGGTPTTLFGIDADRDTLVRVGSVGGTPVSPNAGELTTVGALGVDAVGPVGLDIETTTTGTGGSATTTDAALASIATSERGRSGLYAVNLTTGAATLVGDIGGSKRPVRDIAVVPAGTGLLAVDKKNRLYTLDSNLTTIVLNRVTITGLARKERVADIDVRPSTGTVYAVTNQNRLYTINLGTGVATAVGDTGVTLNRKGVAGIDFNPVADLLRVVNTTGENLRLDPSNAQAVDADPALEGVQFDTPLVFASTDASAGRTPVIAGIGYSNNLTPAPADTTLLAIDTATDALVTIGSAGGTTSPNSGQVFTVGSLGVDARDPVGFDVVSTAADDGSGGTTVTDTGYAVFKARGAKASLYTINLTTGAATPVGVLAKGVSPTGFAVLPAAV
ncbi:MAG TPA: DUF4394 domain-containing protein [Humisphaera sp.]